MTRTADGRRSFSEQPGGPPEDRASERGRFIRSRNRLRRYFSRRRSPLWLELGVIVWLCWLYDAINNLSPFHLTVAYEHARDFLHFEQFLHIDPEATLDRWVSSNHVLSWIAGNYYDNVHFAVTLGLIGLLWWRFPERYRPLRNGLVLTNLAAMVIFWWLPTAPPRLLNPSVFPDVVGNSHAFGSWHTGTLATAANQVAAMPSMHIGWGMWSALVVWRIAPKRWWRYLAWAYPVLTTVVVMATGNHYLVDALAGAALFVLSQIFVERWGGWWTAREARRALGAAAPAVSGDGAQPYVASTHQPPVSRETT